MTNKSPTPRHGQSRSVFGNSVVVADQKSSQLETQRSRQVPHPLRALPTSPARHDPKTVCVSGVCRATNRRRCTHTDRQLGPPMGGWKVRVAHGATCFCALITAAATTVRCCDGGGVWLIPQSLLTARPAAGVPGVARYNSFAPPAPPAMQAAR